MEIYGSDLRPLKIPKIKDRLEYCNDRLTALQYVKFVVLHWLIDAELEVQVFRVQYPQFINYRNLPWQRVNRYRVFFYDKDNNPKIRWRELELTFTDNEQDHHIITTLEIPGGSKYQVNTYKVMVPQYNPKKKPRTDEHDEAVIANITENCVRVFLNNLIIPFRAGKDEIPPESKPRGKPTGVELVETLHNTLRDIPDPKDDDDDDGGDGSEE